MKEIMAVSGFFILQPLVLFVVARVAQACFLAFIAPSGFSAQVQARLLTDFFQAYSNLLSSIANLLIIGFIGCMARRQKIPFKVYTGLKGARPPVAVLLLCLGAAVAANFWFSLVLDSGLFPSDMLAEYGQAVGALNTGAFVIELMYVMILAPLTEELLFRGLILGRLGRILPPGAAIIMQGLLFGCLHVDTLWILYAAILGCIIGYIRVRTGSLLSALLFHMAFNGASYLTALFYGYFGDTPWVKNSALVVSGLLLLAGLWEVNRRSRKLVS